MINQVASVTFGTAIVKTEEALLLVKAAMENGADLETAYDDMKMIDHILQIKRLHFVVHGQIKLTRAGHLRKGTSLYNAIDSIISSRCVNS